MKKTVLDYLEALSRRKRIVEEVGKVMTAGDVWHYPVGLKEGVDYSFKVRGCKGAEVTCALTNGNGAGPVREAKGTEVTFSYAPRASGTYGLALSLNSTTKAMQQGKVIVTLSEEYMPKSYKSRMFS
jgi:hypothetical protein